MVRPLSNSALWSASSAVLTVVFLIFGPWAVGKVIQFLVFGKHFRKRRGVQALQKMESSLATELRADDSRGFRVALVHWPNKETRTLGLVVGDLSEPETARELVAVYFPDTPDPTKGEVRIVPFEALTMTDWSISDLTRFHVTFGSACPDLTDLGD